MVFDAHHAQVVPEDPGYIAGAVVAQQPGPVFHRHLVDVQRKRPD